MAGGAEHVAINLSNGFIKRGLDVDFLLACPGEQLFFQLPKEVNVIRFNKSRTVFAIPHLVAYLNRCKPDAVISFLTHANIISVISKVLASYRGKLILTEHSSVSQNLIKQPGYKNRIMVLLMKRLYSQADKVVAVSMQLMQELELLTGLRNVMCIYNPVDTSVPADENVVDLKKMLKPDPAIRYSIVAVGRLTKAKNFSLLIRSVDQVRRKVPIVLNIIGEGEEHTNLYTLINELGLSDHVFLQGYSDKPKVWMRLSDLFVLSSSWEGFALVVAEALSVGTTVVSTNCPAGPAEILDNGKYGYLVPVNDPEKMADAIMHALKNPLNPDLLKKRAEDFAIPRITDQYLSLIYESSQDVR